MLDGNVTTGENDKLEIDVTLQQIHEYQVNVVEVPTSHAELCKENIAPRLLFCESMTPLADGPSQGPAPVSAIQANSIANGLVLCAGPPGCRKVCGMKTAATDLQNADIYHQDSEHYPLMPGSRLRHLRAPVGDYDTRMSFCEISSLRHGTPTRTRRRHQIRFLQSLDLRSTWTVCIAKSLIAATSRPP